MGLFSLRVQVWSLGTKSSLCLADPLRSMKTLHIVVARKMHFLQFWNDFHHNLTVLREFHTTLVEPLRPVGMRFLVSRYFLTQYPSKRGKKVTFIVWLSPTEILLNEFATSRRPWQCTMAVWAGHRDHQKRYSVAPKESWIRSIFVRWQPSCMATVTSHLPVRSSLSEESVQGGNWPSIQISVTGL